MGHKRDKEKSAIATRKALYVRHLTENGVPAAAARFAGWTTSTVGYHQKQDEAFDNACREAQGLANGDIELEIRRRAIEGDEEVLVQQGSVVYMRDPDTDELVTDEIGDPIPVKKRIRSDRLLETLAKANMPEKYRDNIKVDHAVSGGVLLVGMRGEPSPEAKALGLTLEQEMEQQQAQYRTKKTIEHVPSKPQVKK